MDLSSDESSANETLIYADADYWCAAIEKAFLEKKAVDVDDIIL